MFYLSTPSSFFPVIVRRMGAANLNNPPGFVRVVIEKPFGHDLESARELAEIVHLPFQERQIFRIDHYLGKETVQNIFAFRFANTIFEPIWNNRFVDHVQITVAESIGVEHRAKFYEETGVVRDIVQNHLLQVLALVAMEPPSSFDADPIRDEKTKLLRAMRPMRFEDAVRGQYGAGYVAGDEVLPYTVGAPGAGRQQHGHLRGGPARDRQLAVGGHAVLHPGRQAAGEAGDGGGGAVPASAAPPVPPRCGGAPGGELAGAADPAQRGHLAAVRRQGSGAHAHDPLREHGLPVRKGVPVRRSGGVRTLILDAIRGDGTLFTRQDGVERSWEICDPLIDQWRTGTPQVYEAGSWGPEMAHELINRDGRRWRRP